MFSNENKIGLLMLIGSIILILSISSTAISYKKRFPRDANGNPIYTQYEDLIQKAKSEWGKPR